MNRRDAEHIIYRMAAVEQLVVALIKSRDHIDILRIFEHPNDNLALDEGEQVGVDDVGLRCDHAVRVVLVWLAQNRSATRLEERPTMRQNRSRFSLTLTRSGRSFGCRSEPFR
jgi:hypothetical protein